MRRPGFQALAICFLAFADPEHLGAAGWASTLCRRLAVLHLYSLGIAHLLLLAAFHTVCLHLVHLLFLR
jgi:hypothetical protein